MCSHTPRWRWRSNPLRRRDDVIEAWIVVAVWTVMVLGGALVGAVTASTAWSCPPERRRSYAAACPSAGTSPPKIRASCTRAAAPTPRSPPTRSSPAVAGSAWRFIRGAARP
ncbi:hypothetical protein FNH04_09685 [Streptomyces phyllanthi]|uniref:Uncharacterized protein n=1 Tax=Streptomyces phyllanthi TaxID=1803180 RepID=A0A5N8VY25_9ACTN|nr:hypothetical protein [Streptomyces phyllanthi]